MQTRQVIAITGGGSGLGRALALLYARRHWRVAISDLAQDRITAVAQEIEAAGGEALGMIADIRNAGDMDAFAQAVVSRWERIDIFVNNAGVAAAGSLEQTSLEDWQWMLDINLLGVVRGSKAAAPVMRRQGFGHIVNVASLAGVACAPMMASYNVAKAGVIALSESLRGDLSRTQVGVSVVCPSYFVSDLHSHAKSANDAQMQIMKKLVTRSRYTADDIAAAIAAAVENRRFMVLPQTDAKVAYWFKRIAPERFFRWVNKKSGGLFAAKGA